MSGYTISITQEDLYTVLSTFLQTILGLAQSVVLQGLPNRSAMPPAAPGFVTMQLTHNNRQNYNIDTWDYTDPAPIIATKEQHVAMRLQIDFYGATSGDWATIFTTIWRDEVGVLQLTPTCEPLYTGDPMLAALEDDELQYEQRWTVEAFLQYNPVTTVPQDFMASPYGPVQVINVDKTYPP
jgi:hypothetical protein